MLEQQAAILAATREVLCTALKAPVQTPQSADLEAKTYAEVIKERKQREAQHVRDSALQEAIYSTLHDPSLDNEAKADLVRQSISEFLIESDELAARPAAEKQQGDYGGTVSDVKKPGNPWRIEKRGDKFVVVQADSGKVMGSHDSKEDAAKQVAALHSKVKE